jgi:putative flippase GtrA
MKLKESTGQFLKFVFVGIVNTAIDWIVFFLLKLIPFFLANRPYAKAISFLVAAINSFILNSAWTFKKEYQSSFENHDGEKLSKNGIYFGRFIAVSLIGWVVNTLTYTITINHLPSFAQGRFSDVFALALASATGIIWNFFANKYWTYTKIKTEVITPLERKKRRWFNLIGVVLLGTMAVISFMVMRNDSAIVDEVAHIPAGYSYVKYLDYRLNPEHPPLAKAIAALPLQFVNLKGVDQSAAWNDVGQWEAGWDFIYRFGNNADQILMLARIPMILLLLTLGFYVYRFAVENFGRRTAVFVLTLFAFYPDLLAHGHLVTTDVAAALGFMIAVYYFNHWINNRTKKNLIIAGIAFGLAQLLKFSAVLLIPILFLYIFFKAFSERGAKKFDYWRSFWSLLKSTIWIGLIGLGVIYLVYLPLVWNTPAGIEHKLIEMNLTSDPRTQIFRTFLHFFENTPFLRAIGHYILGIFLVFGRVGGGNNTFILGHYSDKGISWFFPVAWLIKTPLPVIFLLGGSILLFFKKGNFKKNLWLNTLLLTPIFVYWAITLKGSLNIGIRHLMPTVPFVLLFIGSQMRPYLAKKLNLRHLVFAGLALWMVIGAIITYPNYMSYFNETTIGMNKYDLMVDSSLDWGQDLKRLATYVKDNHIENIKVDYFGGGVPDYYIPGVQQWHSGNGPTTGYLAISATFYQFSKMSGPKEDKWSYDWLDHYKPITVIGNSILVFNITPAELAANPPVSPYPITKYDPITVTPATPTHDVK